MTGVLKQPITHEGTSVEEICIGRWREHEERTLLQDEATGSGPSSERQDERRPDETMQMIVKRALPPTLHGPLGVGTRVFCAASK